MLPASTRVAAAPFPRRTGQPPRDDTPSAPSGVTVTVGSGSDTLALKVSEDAWQGDAQYTVSVDGAQVGGTLTAHASRASGQDDTVNVLGNWAAGNHAVAVNFLNDAYGGTPAADRNLYVDGATYDGTAVSGATLMLYNGGPQTFGFVAYQG